MWALKALIYEEETALSSNHLLCNKKTALLPTHKFNHLHSIMQAPLSADKCLLEHHIQPDTFYAKSTFRLTCRKDLGQVLSLRWGSKLSLMCFNLEHICSWH